jgi:hypothetical protein
MNSSDASARRLERLQHLLRNRRLIPYELALCSQDVAYWVNNWGWTYDPREADSTIPFILFPKQAEFFDWLREREKEQADGLVEKSRDMGATWLCCAYALHGWLFRSGYHVGFGSRKLELVDKKGDPDCIFEKVRFLLRHLPAWMMPAKFTWKEHDCYTKLINPDNGSTITGEGGDQIGRGGRASIYFIDEAAFLEHPQLVERALSQTTRVRIDVSTPNGQGNPFAKKRHGGKVSVFTLHWTCDPRKNRSVRTEDGREVFPWYEKQKSRLDPVTVAQEIDIDYTASVEGICIPAAWVRAAVGLELPVRHDRPLPVVAGLDIGEEGNDSTVFTPRAGPLVFDPVSWSKTNTTETAWRARDEAVRVKAELVNYDCGGVGAGVKGTWLAAGKLPFAANAVQFGESPTDAIWPDGRMAKELFVNLRAEMWWSLRARFERTFEYVTKGIPHPPDELISIPNHPQLIAELSLPLAFRNEAGKIKLESKEAMRRRGVKSPDYGDSLALAFLPSVQWGPVTNSKESKSLVADIPEGVFAFDDRRERERRDSEGQRRPARGILDGLGDW